MTLRTLLTNLDSLDADRTIYVAGRRNDWSPDMEAVVLQEDVESDDWQPPAGLTYFLEVGIARDVVRDWLAAGHVVSGPDDVIRVVMYYARWDAWPAE
jgi:hypothetical protein